jgi:hypothetical protein
MFKTVADVRRHRGSKVLGLVLVASAACGAAPGGDSRSVPGPIAAPTAGPEDDGRITAGDRAAVIAALTSALDQYYVFPDKAAAIGKQLRARQLAGSYDRLDRGQAFAQAVTGDLVAIAHDKHLEVRYLREPVPATEAERSPAIDDEEAAEMRYVNHGVFEVRRMKFNLGYLNFNAFGRPVKVAGDKLGAAMRLLADTHGVIIDLRDCHGGDTDTVTLAESYFVPPNTHLVDLYERTTNTTEQARAAVDLAGPRYAADRPVFVLISENTASGCEAFAYALQARKRATVVGSHSAGAAYFGGPRRLTEHFMAFVPVGRPIDPITHGDWEGTGVIPTIAVPPGEAAVAAERAILETIEPLERNGRRRAAMQKRLAELRAPAAP